MTNARVALVDTNVIIRYLLLDDPKFNATVTTFFSAVKTGDQQAVVVDAVIAECVYVLSGGYEIDKPAVAHSLKGLLCYKGICCQNKKELMLALDTWSTHRLDFVDCLLFAMSKNSLIPLQTFDTKLKKLLES